MDSFNLRQEFLDFFEKKGHKIVPAYSLIPSDASVLFTTSGMQQFKPYYLKGESLFGKKVANCQKCLRTSDINDVGDKSHLTFFEMLGNFSFDDYFREETVKLALEFLLEVCSLSIDRMWFSYFKGDSQAPEDIKSKKVLLSNNILEKRIIAMGRKDNFWGPTGEEGPCGPTIDIYYDLTSIPCKKEEQCSLDCECGRFVELWSLVFNEYYQDSAKKIFSIEEKGGKKGIDTGLGLVRLAAASQGKKTIFETDLFQPLIDIIDRDKNSKESRIIADHIKASCFLISEGIIPSKVDKGYILRRLLRKAIRCKRILQGGNNLLTDLAKKVIELYKDIYPELKSKQEEILTIIQKEEEDFSKALDRGLIQFEKLLKEQQSEKIISGKNAFILFETYGFPLELTEELAQERGFLVDKEGFNNALNEHQKISRAGAEKKFGGIGKEAEEKEAINLHTATHLLHSALRKILGDSARQMGSDINRERLRFDFSFDRKLTDEEIERIEHLVNEKIKADLVIEKENMLLKDALESGAMSFFKEKYPERVSVYSIDDFSKEICAGPHAKHTSELGNFKIIKQESVGSGIRRIKAILN
jgi:alanyl-tRNA synthetase